MSKYVATVNVPGYPPTDDKSPTFDTAQEAWEYLADERRIAENELYDGGESDGFSRTVHELERRSDDRWLVCDFERVGTVHGPTPGRGDHDLGLDYCVTEVSPLRAENRALANLPRLNAKARAFLLGVREFRLSATTHFDDYDLLYTYDRGRELAHKLTRRKYDDTCT